MDGYPSGRYMEWVKMKQIFRAHIPVIHEIDVLSGLLLFMPAAAEPTSNIESVYNLLKIYPVAISLTGGTY